MLREDGSIEKISFFVGGRKCPLAEIRRRKLHELEKFMQISDVDNMSATEVENRLTMLNERKEGEDETEMRNWLKVMEIILHLLASTGIY